MTSTRTSEATIRPARAIGGSLRLPGDKSISHRYAMLASIARGRTTLRNFSSGADCASTLACMAALGCRVERAADGAVVVEGRGPALAPPAGVLDCGNSGSTMRMLAGILAAQPFACEMRGDSSLSRRPMARVIEPLERMGARITAAEGGRPPLRVQGGRLRGIEYTMPVASAQVKSCLLFAGLLAQGTTRVAEPHRTRDHGELALRAFGAQVTREKTSVAVAGGQPLEGIDADVPGDISSAAFFLCAAAARPGSQLIVDGVLLNPTRAAILDVLAGMGAAIRMLNVEEHHGELVGTVQITGARLRGGSIAGAQTAALIDELPVLAALAPFTAEGVEIRDAKELRVKESDRIAVLAKNLRALGAKVEEREDGMRVAGNQALHGARIEPDGDHRIAMACAVAALGAEGASVITDAGCVGISFPGFFELLESVSER
ncbi:MAG TPA: 3-phosphoshikimate 1-carboxyvinyltransferase [Terriglobales bacterium]|nr:3-phosphoshikimate 1-carboxyvinyltransferase [Terriglobales bacterium]